MAESGTVVLFVDTKDKDIDSGIESRNFGLIFEILNKLPSECFKIVLKIQIYSFYKMLNLNI